METLKKILNSFLIVFIAEVAVGALLLINPDIFTKTISYILGGIALAFGVLNLITYFSSYHTQVTIINAILLCIAGIFIISRPDSIIKILAFIFGLLLLGDGLTSIKSALVLKDCNDTHWVPSMIMALLTTILGFIVILNPLASANTAIKILGVSLIISGIFSIYNGLVTKKKINKVEKSSEYIDIK